MPGPDPPSSWDSKKVARSSFVVKRMKDRHWCLRRIFELLTSFNSPTLAFASDFDMQHKIEHDRCTELSCVFSEVKLEDYKTQHADGCSDCSFVLAREEQINEILKRRAFPLVNTIDQDNHQEIIDLTDSSREAGYVAISHVWSDGLGNPDDNAIPRCQLLKLSSMVRSLEGDSSNRFWLDTICCPPDGKDREAQDLAIGMMRETYKRADKVLVLDSFLLKHSAKPLSDAEVLLRIVCCGWNGRLWTLQEGALSKQLYFQFADGPYALEEGLQRLHRQTNIVIRNTLQPSIDQHFSQIQPFRKSSMSELEKFIAVTRALRFRTTSVISDEPICLATLLGLDTLAIVKKGFGKSDEMDAHEERMVLLWTMVKAIPAIIVFLDCPRLKVDGYRWAPRSFLRSSSEELAMSHEPEFLNYVFKEKLGRLGPRGLSVQFPGFGLTFHWQHSLAETFDICDQHHRWYRVELQVEYCDRATAYDMPAHPGVCPHIVKRHKIDPFLLPDGTVPSLMLISHPCDMKLAGHIPGILVAKVSEEDNVFYVKSVCNVLLGEFAPREYEIWQKNGVRENIVNISEPETQKWEICLLDGCVTTVNAELFTQDANLVVD